MAYRRKIIDRRTREGKAMGKQLDALQGIAVIALIAFGLIYGLVKSDKPSSSEGQPEIIAPARAASFQPSATGYLPGADHGLPNGFASSAQPTTPISDAASTGYVPFARTQLPIGSDVDAGRKAVPWRHATAAGTRWSLRHINQTAMLLVVDLGGDQIANVTVDPAFENLDIAGMNARVDHVRLVIGQRFPIQTANYSFDRAGTLLQIP